MVYYTVWQSTTGTSAQLVSCQLMVIVIVGTGTRPIPSSGELRGPGPGPARLQRTVPEWGQESCPRNYADLRPREGGCVEGSLPSSCGGGGDGGGDGACGAPSERSPE